MSSIRHLLDRNRAWAADVTARQPDFFRRLAAQQAPRYLWIGCADSRVPANEIVDLDPGELFVHRNVANVVVHTDFNCLSVLQFAVDVLKVEHVMVVGHYGCGGIRAAIEDSAHGLIDNWLRHVQDVAFRYRDELALAADGDARIDRLCELNVIEQVVNVARTTIMQGAWTRGQRVTLHGFVYGLNDGLLRDLGVEAASMGVLEGNYASAIARYRSGQMPALTLDWPLSALATARCALALFAGYAVRGAAGFGSGVVTTPLMAFVLPLSTVAPLVTFLGMFVSVRQMWIDRPLIAWKHLAAFLPGIAIGVPLGIRLFSEIDPALLVRALGVYVIGYALYSLSQCAEAGRTAGPPWTAIPIGTAGSIVATLFGGMGGPVYVTYLDGVGLAKRVFRVTVSTTLLVLAVARSIAYLAAGVFRPQDFLLVLAAALPVAIGTLAGEWMHDRIDPATFRRLAGGLLIVSGILLLVKPG